jgi:DNA-binding XRE family transcriptional regulator
MQKNSIRVLRKKKGMTQSQLAEVAKTSQQQIQRIESGVQSARFDVALQICAALQAPMQEVFPATKKPLGRSLAKGNTFEDLLKDEDIREKMEKAGVDMDLRIFTVELLLRNGVTLFYGVSRQERDRLWKEAQQPDAVEKFFIFDSDEERVAVNRNHLVFIQFLFDPPNVRIKSATDTDDPDGGEEFLMKIYTTATSDPLELGVDPDEVAYIDVIEGKADEGQARVQSLMEDIGMCVEEKDVFHFTDEDGETAFFRAEYVALLSVPLRTVEPKLWSSEMEGFREDEHPSASNPEDAS